MIYVFNGAETDERLKSNEPSEYKGRSVVYVSAKIEFELASLSLEDQLMYLSDMGISESGLDKISRSCFNKLGLITFFTAGIIEVRAWQIKSGSTAQKASAAIHTDFEKNFIKAEVVGYEDYITHGSKHKAKEAGKLKLEGKEYIVKDADVIEFKIGA